VIVVLDSTWFELRRLGVVPLENILGEDLGFLARQVCVELAIRRKQLLRQDLL
jgi:hypothetical protein